MRFKSGHAFIFLFFLFGSIVPAFGQPQKLSRTEVVIDFKEDGYFKTIPYIALQNDLFFISDNFNHRVLEYRLTGNKMEFLRVIGRKGQGPGDLMLPCDISVSDGTLAVKDEHGISFFGFDGTFRSKFKLLSWCETMLFSGNAVYAVSTDQAMKDLIPVYDTAGTIARSFLQKSSLYTIRPEIHKGMRPNDVERTVFEGDLRFSNGSLFYMNRRFGDVLQYSPMGARISSRNLFPLLSKVEKAKIDSNRKTFLEEGYDLIKNRGNIPNRYIFTDARILNGRLFLLLENYDILEKKARAYTEIVEIDLAAWQIINTYIAEAAAKWESASGFLVLGETKKPIFLTVMRAPDEDWKIFLLAPEK